ncbi:UNC5C-like protein [Saccoglossus kowalevskii]|uniref:Netrin receptor UNC5 n=1 Tax=Saccoglossus kowalevskii TaxID=10224 RepID=A0ABM0GKQ3_SACKO|nr:PREDICTED: UNC5C-like protein-like [Saccoglossus kowalevskii]
MSSPNHVIIVVVSITVVLVVGIILYICCRKKFCHGEERDVIQYMYGSQDDLCDETSVCSQSVQTCNDVPVMMNGTGFPVSYAQMGETHTVMVHKEPFGSPLTKPPESPTAQPSESSPAQPSGSTPTQPSGSTPNWPSGSSTTQPFGSSPTHPSGSPTTQLPESSLTQPSGSPANGSAATSLASLPDAVLLEELETHMEHSKTHTICGKLMVCISRTVDHTGDCLVLDKMGISLYIPPYAIAEGHKETIFLILDWDLGDFPQMSSEQSIISPVVYCGPHGLKFNKRCRLCYKHCASDTSEVTIWASQTYFFPEKSWEIHHEQNNSSENIRLLSEECQIYTTHFTLFTCLTQQVNTNSVAKKWLQLAAFARPIQVGKYYEVRIYFLNNTPCALQFAEQNEATKFDAYLLTPAQPFLFLGNGGAMCLELMRVSKDWVNEDNNLEVRPFLSVWHGECPHVQFVFKPSNNQVKEINITFAAYQSYKKAEQTTLKIVAEAKDEKPAVVESNRASTEPSYKRSESYHIPHWLRIELQAMLDGDCPLGKNWKALASYLGLDRFIHSFERKESPTYYVLLEFETRGEDLSNLAMIMNKIGRCDVKRLIEDYLITVQLDTSCKSETLSALSIPVTRL